MQFAVPQFTDVEDKLIGPFTLKQFLILLATGGVVMFFWSLLNFSVFFFMFAIPVVILGLALTFGRFNGRPLFSYMGSFITFFSKPQVRIFKREELDTLVQVQKSKPNASRIPEVIQEPAESRLKKLAYLLDQKTAEEKELMLKEQTYGKN